MAYRKTGHLPRIRAWQSVALDITDPDYTLDMAYKQKDINKTNKANSNYRAKTTYRNHTSLWFTISLEDKKILKNKVHYSSGNL